VLCEVDAASKYPTAPVKKRLIVTAKTTTEKHKHAKNDRADHYILAKPLAVIADPNTSENDNATNALEGRRIFFLTAEEVEEAFQKTYDIVASVKSTSDNCGRRVDAADIHEQVDGGADQT
jgi:hypothetical protein